jgi:hypothetical protein
LVIGIPITHGCAYLFRTLSSPALRSRLPDYQEGHHDPAVSMLHTPLKQPQRVSGSGSRVSGRAHKRGGALEAIHPSAVLPVPAAARARRLVHRLTSGGVDRLNSFVCNHNSRARGNSHMVLTL